ncbi:MAG: branched-chain amino acid ABC transporter permease [Candidatus Dormibacteraceae bacterium]
MGTEITRAVIDGILTGAVYALMGAGLTLVFGVMNIINIAQGVLVVLAAYLTYVLNRFLGLDLFVGLALTIPMMFLVGVAIERLFIRRLQSQGNRTGLSILVTYAVAIIIEGLLTVVFSADYLHLHAWYVDRSLPILGFYLPYIYLMGFGLAVGMLAVLYVILYRTRLGMSIRASVQSRLGAELVGIDINRTSTLAFGIGTAVTAAGGMIFGATSVFNPNSGYDLISVLLVIIVLGGLGSIGGALIAGVVMLVIEDVTAVLWSPIWSSTMFFAVLVVVLIVHPTGLFGKPETRAQ